MTTTNKRSWYKKWWGVIIILFIVIFLSISTALGLAFLKLIQNIRSVPPETINYQIDTEKRSLIEGENSYWLGSSQPKVTIVEFGDYACPVCKKSFPKIRELGQRYKADVKFIYRDYPVVTEYSLDLSLAANCAGEQGLFWVIHDKLFINQGIKEMADIRKLAAQIGLDAEKFNSCLDQKNPLNRIQKNLADGQELEIAGTPTYFINGQKISGDIPYEMLENIIKKYLGSGI